MVSSPKASRRTFLGTSVGVGAAAGNIPYYAWSQPAKGPVTINGTGAKHPVPFKDGYPERDDSFNTSRDFAVKCTFPSNVEMTVTCRSDNGILSEGEKAAPERLRDSTGLASPEPLP